MMRTIRKRVGHKLFWAALVAVLLVFPAAGRAENPASDPAIWIDFGQLERAQKALLEKQFAHLSERKGSSDIYVVGLAGWSNEDVFVKELDGALASIGKTLPISADRTVRLINNVATLDTIPVANPENFATAIHAVAAAMDKEKDVLIVFITTHGTPDGVVLKLGRAIALLTPRQVAEALDGEQIKNRIVIVSACYSGVYLKPLANDDTIVLTAADSHNPSFGCGAKRSWTYFGDAFFNQSLRPGVDFRGAFVKATALIKRWEAADKLRPSNPQSYFGAALARKLAPIFKAGVPRS